jgi:hypothetical protein
VRSPDPSRYSYVGTAQQYIARSREPISDTDRRVFQHAQEKVTEIVNKVNGFYTTQWPAYRTLMEKVVINPFKDDQPLNKN